MADNVNLPLRIIPAVQEEGRSRVSINLKVSADFSYKLFGSNIVVKVRDCMDQMGTGPLGNITGVSASVVWPCFCSCCTPSYARGSSIVVGISSFPLCVVMHRWMYSLLLVPLIFHTHTHTCYFVVRMHAGNIGLGHRADGVQRVSCYFGLE